MSELNLLIRELSAHVRNLKEENTQLKDRVEWLEGCQVVQELLKARAEVVRLTDIITHRADPKRMLYVGRRENADPVVGQKIIWRGSNGKDYPAEVLKVIGTGSYLVQHSNGEEFEIYDENIVAKEAL